MPLEIKHHTVPHLKALTRSIEHRGGHGDGGTFKQLYPIIKSTVLLHKWLKRRFHVTVAVYQNSLQGFITSPVLVPSSYVS